MPIDFNLNQILNNGETRNTEFKRVLTERDGKGDRQGKLIAQLKLITSEGEGHFVIGIEDIHGKKWEIYGLTQEEVETSEEILTLLCKEAGIEILEQTFYNTDKGMVVVLHSPGKSPQWSLKP